MTDRLTMDELDEQLQRLAEPLVQKRSLLQQERLDLIAQREEVDQQLAKVNKLLRPLRPDLFEDSEPASAAKKTAKRTTATVQRPGATGFGISKGKLDECRAWVGEYLSSHDQVTQTDAMLGLGWDQSKTSAGFRALRAEGFIRQSGQKGSVKFYKLTPEAAQEATHGAS